MVLRLQLEEHRLVYSLNQEQFTPHQLVLVAQQRHNPSLLGLLLHQAE
jgi:hypothetical protein